MDFQSLPFNNSLKTSLDCLDQGIGSRACSADALISTLKTWHKSWVAMGGVLS